MVSTFGFWSLGTPQDALSNAAPSSATWEAVNKVVYTPVRIPLTTICKRVWWVNGATVSGGATIEVGVYADAGFQPGAKLLSASATQGTANNVQFADVTDTPLTPGLWWLALRMSSITNTTGFSNNLGGGSGFKARTLEQLSQNPLPATATAVERTTGRTWVYGFSTHTFT